MFSFSAPKNLTGIPVWFWNSSLVLYFWQLEVVEKGYSSSTLDLDTKLYMGRILKFYILRSKCSTWSGLDSRLSTWKITSSPKLHYNLGGGFKYFLFSPRKLGKWSNLTVAYFSDGLVQPPTSNPKYESLMVHNPGWNLPWRLLLPCWITPEHTGIYVWTRW